MNFSRKNVSASGDAVASNAMKHKDGYEQITPEATYAPWTTDRSFSEIYETIKSNTLVDKYRCYELWQLVKESAKLDGAIIEIGVWRGGTGSLIAKQAELCGIRSTVYLCDTFTGVVKAGTNDSRYRNGEHADTSKVTVEGLVKKLGLKNTKILVGIFPDETSPYIEDCTFRFCHIDVDVYQSAKDIVDWVWAKMAIGGIVVFDDYGFSSCDGVTKFVNEQRNSNNCIVMHNLNGHGILIKIT
jgi:O-methyltransferase